MHVGTHMHYACKLSLRKHKQGDRVGLSLEHWVWIMPKLFVLDINLSFNSISMNVWGILQQPAARNGAMLANGPETPEYLATLVSDDIFVYLVERSGH